VAGELAISLVNAARVFEVLVAVVLIGEHLAASLALIPSAVCTHPSLITSTTLLTSTVIQVCFMQDMCK